MQCEICVDHSHIMRSVDYSNERRNESEFKAEAAQQRVEELEPELNSMREAYEQSQKALHALRGAQEEMMEQRCQELQAQLEEVMLELESWKGDLAASGAFKSRAVVSDVIAITLN
jgi:hypothetical protein